MSSSNHVLRTALWCTGPLQSSAVWLEQQWRCAASRSVHPYRQYRVHPPHYTRQTPELHTEEPNNCAAILLLRRSTNNHSGRPIYATRINLSTMDSKRKSNGNIAPAQDHNGEHSVKRIKLSVSCAFSFVHLEGCDVER